MRDEIVNLVDPVFSYGLRLRDRLHDGESPDLETEQAKLLALLNAPEGRRYNEFYGEESSSPSVMSVSRAADVARSADRFLGIRYALACWLDEMFVMDSPWRGEWENWAIEVKLFQMRDRAWKFWEQARRAEGRAGGDAQEVFFLCSMLGFRGELVDKPDEFQKRVTAMKARVARGQGKDWPAPPDLGATTFVPPRRGRHRLRRMTLVAAAALLLLIPLVLLLSR